MATRKAAVKPARKAAKPAKAAPKAKGKPASRKAKAPAKAPAKAAARKPQKRAVKLDLPEGFDLGELGARVISVFGPFNSRVLIELSADLAMRLFAEPLERSSRTTVIEAAMRDVQAIRKRDPELAKSALAAAAVALAYEIEHPYNSATSKSMCSRELRETIDRLRELAPEQEETDRLDELTAQRSARIDGG